MNGCHKNELPSVGVGTYIMIIGYCSMPKARINTRVAK